MTKAAPAFKTARSATAKGGVAGGPNRDGILLADAAGEEGVGEIIGGGIELGVGQGPARRGWLAYPGGARRHGEKCVPTGSNGDRVEGAGGSGGCGWRWREKAEPGERE